MRRHPFKLTLLTVGLIACGDPAAKAAAEQAATLESIDSAASTARAAAALPATGLWSEAQLLDRLVRTGVAPRVNEAASIEAVWMNSKTIALLAGGGEVYAWIYRDSTARRAVTDKLDSLTAVPPGIVSPFTPPMVFVTNNNIALVISGGSVTNQDRITLAIQAGLPAPPK